MGTYDVFSLYSGSQHKAGYQADENELVLEHFDEKACIVHFCVTGFDQQDHQSLVCSNRYCNGHAEWWY